MVKNNHSSLRCAMAQHKFLRYFSFLTARGGGWWRCVLLLLGLIFISSTVFAADLSLDEVIAKIQANQSKIEDMYAETTTKITSNIQLQTSKQSGPQTMIQKGKMWTKGEDKSKIEMLSPMRQITITNGDKMAIINPDTGQKIIQDLKKMREKSGMPDSSKQMSLEKAKEFFDLSAKRLETRDPRLVTEYVITGVPKKENKFIMGKMEFYIDSEKWVPVKIMMYDAKGKPMSESEIEYQRWTMDEGRGTIWVPIKNISNVTTPMGTMKVEMTFEKIKVNQGISDKEFTVD